MEKTNKTRHIPQFQVRSNLVAGESVEACLKNVDYWQKAYIDKCAKQGVIVTPVPYP